jgi:lipopolysaccharide/colanic/teichoic acid biosynthesis glycosyltransferase
MAYLKEGNRVIGNERRTAVARLAQKKKQGRHALHAPEVFHALLRHERARVNRDGKAFSLVVFEDGPIPSGNHSTERFISACWDSMRAIDEMGWMVGKRIGVILPLTGHEGAATWAFRLREGLQAGAASPTFAIYTYPDEWPTEDGDDHAALFSAIFCPPIPRWKRVLDAGGSLAMLLVLSPLLMLIAAFIKGTSRGPLIFKQQRVGRNGRVFTFYKFRTMKPEDNQADHMRHILAAIHAGTPLTKLDDEGDRRIIFGGRILRRSCLDELPQLFNVLRGDMSLVGPRPCMPYEAREFRLWQVDRFDILPGMTGLWQVSGKNRLTLDQMIRLDIQYAHRMSPGYDLRILFLTVPAIILMVLASLAKKLGMRAESTDAGCARGNERPALNAPTNDIPFNGSCAAGE